MKIFARISALFLALLMLAGCSKPNESKQNEEADTNESTPETTAVAPTTDVAPSTSATAPTSSVPTTTTTATTAPTTPEKPAVPESPATSAGFGAVYAEICSYLDNINSDQNYTYVSTGIMEAASDSNVSTRYSSITYALEDIDGNGQKEMIVLNSMGNTQILAIYTLQGGQPTLTREGSSRSRLYRLRDGQLYWEGSNGAASAFFDVGGQRWFTYPNADYTDLCYYYAADGSYDPATAQQITEEEYTAKQMEFSQTISPFSVYNFSK